MADSLPQKVERLIFLCAVGFPAEPAVAALPGSSQPVGEDFAGGGEQGDVGNRPAMDVFANDCVCWQVLAEDKGEGDRRIELSADLAPEEEDVELLIKADEIALSIVAATGGVVIGCLQVKQGKIGRVTNAELVFTEQPTQVEGGVGGVGGIGGGGKRLRGGGEGSRDGGGNQVGLRGDRRRVRAARSEEKNDE